MLVMLALAGAVAIAFKDQTKASQAFFPGCLSQIFEKNH
ncbi:hypothetical protein C942_00557 [Photobacterium marinum]|uniref:Uncharacterized protein n=1 Tax=Photobacterium marinum TaxID=1056511 RepID=L8JAV8_9GAMM|nr:hypothetical protein C942_00557 [Photobacterium marinum]